MRYEIRWHGRGGQGAVTASIILAEAATSLGLYAQAFPEFGPERRGAPVKAYTRISDKPIEERSPILEPDIVVVLDPALPSELYMQGMKRGGAVVINTKRPAQEVAKSIGADRVVAVDATSIALKILRAPIVNVAMLGALSRAIGMISVESLAKATLKVLFGLSWEGSLDELLKTPLAEPVLGNVMMLLESYRSAEVVP